MQLVLVAHRCRTTFQVTHVRVIISHDERTLKLSCITGIDAEIATQLHRTTNALGDIDKRAVAKDRTVQCCIEIITIGNHGAEILAHQFAMLLDGLTDGAEDDALLAEFLLEGGLHAHGIHDGIHGSISTQGQPLFKGNT